MDLIDRLRNEQRSLLVFSHGLGDICNWLPIYKEIVKQVGKRIDIGVQSKRQFQLFCPNAVLTDKIDVKSRYSFIYTVGYREPKEGMNKALYCAEKEFGLKDFDWQPFSIKNEVDNSQSKRIGVNFFGLTGHKKEPKFCSQKNAEKIWKEIEASGYQPFELYQRVSFINDYSLLEEIPDRFDLATEENSLRFREPNLKTTIEEIKQCRYIISTDSGILYLGLSLLGKDNVIGLENEKKISKYLPIEINKIDIKDYKKNSVYNLLKQGM